MVSNLLNCDSVLEQIAENLTIDYFVAPVPERYFEDFHADDGDPEYILSWLDGTLGLTIDNPFTNIA